MHRGRMNDVNAQSAPGGGISDLFHVMPMDVGYRGSSSAQNATVGELYDVRDDMSQRHADMLDDAVSRCDGEDVYDPGLQDIIVVLADEYL